MAKRGNDFEKIANEFLTEIFTELGYKSIGEKKWGYSDKTKINISIPINIFNLFKKIKDTNSLLKIFSFLINSHSKVNEDLIKEFLLHFKMELSINEVNIKNKLVSIISNAVVEGKIRRSLNDNIFVDLVKFYNIEQEVFFKIFDDTHSVLYPQIFFLADIVKEGFFSEIISKYKLGSINDTFPEVFRDIIWSEKKNKDLAIKFENIVEQNSEFKFSKNINNGESENKIKTSKRDPQREFDVLFNIDELEKQMIEIFKFKKKKKLTYDDVDNFYSILNQDDKLSKNITFSAVNLLWEILRYEFGDSGILKIEDLSKYIIQYELRIMINIKNALPKEEEDIIISKEQEEHIEMWCKCNTEKVKLAYQNFMLNDKLFTEDENNIFKIIFEFQKYFKFDLDEELLLNMIWLVKSSEDFTLDFIHGIVPEKKINERIINNANSTINGHSIYFCVKYFIKNKLDLKLLNLDIKEKIRKLLLLGNDNYYAIRLIELLYSKDFTFLEELIEIKYLHHKGNFLDFVLNILIENKKFETVANYLNVKYKDLIDYHIVDEISIIKYLIMANNELGFQKLRKLIKNNPDNCESMMENLSVISINYSNNKSVDDLITIFKISLRNYSQEKLNKTIYSPLKVSSDTIINICKNQNVDLCENILKKLNQIDLKGNDLFYLNNLKKDIQQIILNHKSKPYNLKKVLKLVEKNKHIFC